jgi:hypothetical protein
MWGEPLPEAEAAEMTRRLRLNLERCERRLEAARAAA